MYKTMSSRRPERKSARLALTVAGLALLLACPLAAQTGTLFVEGDSVGIGTDTPVGSLQIKQNGATLDIEDANSTDAARILLRLTNKGRINFNLFNSSANENWQFSNTLIGFQINQTTSPGVELRVDNNGDLFLEGQVFASSSVTQKQDFHEVDAVQVLEKVRDLPLATWAYKNRTNARHIGPMAEDFYATFSVGLDDRTLSPSDTSGVALAAIQGLGLVLDQKDHKIETLRHRLEAESTRVEELSQRLAELEQALEALSSNR